MKALFEEALAHPPGTRTDFLDSACEDNAALRAEVERLLAADQNADDFLDDSSALFGPLLDDLPTHLHRVDPLY
ncbi:MAG: hypothetical protein HKN04_00860, partial [Rhodothermaceae bacterium]|nr:hypothetical protein [Rhodothermaceae bacterium]